MKFSRLSRPTGSMPVSLRSSSSVPRVAISERHCSGSYNRRSTKPNGRLISITRSTQPTAWSRMCSSSAGTSNSKHWRRCRANWTRTAMPRWRSAPPIKRSSKTWVKTLRQCGDNPACPMALKKKIARTLIHEIVVSLDDDTKELRLIIHWHGGCHTAFTMLKPLSGAVAHKTALEDVALITQMACRYRDDEIARVLSKLGRRTGKG